MNKVSILHPYLEGRRQQICKGLYPRQHLWGVEALEHDGYINASLISTQQKIFPEIVSKIFDRLFFQRSSSLKLEISALKNSLNCELLYSVSGPLGLARFHSHKSKLVSWVFRKPLSLPKSPLHPYHPKNLQRHSGILCLTPKAESFFSQYAPAKFIPWCIDLKLFDAKPCKEKPKRIFFLATGKTGRDYQTLVEGAVKVDAEVRIIGPDWQKPKILPPNVTWLETSSDPPDKTIDYPTLRKWYSQCQGVCIPLSGDSDDTCGYTNMLEGMAMAKPIVMTRSGSLHLNPKDRGFGFIVDPDDSYGWARSMNEIIRNPLSSKQMGNQGRMIAESEFSTERFDNEVLVFLKEILANN